MNARWRGKWHASMRRGSSTGERGGGVFSVLYGHRSKSKANIEDLGMSISQFIWLSAVIRPFLIQGASLSRYPTPSDNSVPESTNHYSIQYSSDTCHTFSNIQFGRPVISIDDNGFHVARLNKADPLRSQF